MNNSDNKENNKSEVTSDFDSDEIINENENNEAENNNENENNEAENNNENENNDENNDENKNEIENKKKVCGFSDFKKEITKLDIGNLTNFDNLDESSEYSYVSIPEDQKIDDNKISYLYIISFLVGLGLIYYFYNGNIFITIIELIVNLVSPYMYICLKIFISKKIIADKLKQL